MVTIHSGELAKWKSNGVFAYKLFFQNAIRVTGVSQRIIDEYEKRTGRKDIIFTPPLIPFKVIKTKNKFREKWNIGAEEIVMLYVGLSRLGLLISPTTWIFTTAVLHLVPDTSLA